ncbi:MAG: 6-carboxytetrahydropterin synthase QueD [Chlorobi bacterium]|nr:6-carboxytetrahydropterin synthase QueD [Chlorobiota bacterium]
MKKIRVTKQFNFESAHALWNYDGKCKNIHGHTYKLFVTVTGSPLQNENSPKYGMVMDFGDLKKTVKKNIVDVFDHAVILNKKAPYKNLENLPQMFERFITTDYQPTCENMVIHFAEILKKHLPENIELFSVRLYETETSYAEWFASDNL